MVRHDRLAVLRRQRHQDDVAPRLERLDDGVDLLQAEPAAVVVLIEIRDVRAVYYCGKRPRMVLQPPVKSSQRRVVPFSRSGGHF